jgi:predicted transglutaminase-like cysteine proteinase
LKRHWSSEILENFQSSLLLSPESLNPKCPTILIAMVFRHMQVNQHPRMRKREDEFQENGNLKCCMRKRRECKENQSGDSGAYELCGSWDW